MSFLITFLGFILGIGSIVASVIYLGFLYDENKLTIKKVYCIIPIIILGVCIFVGSTKIANYYGRIEEEKEQKIIAAKTFICDGKKFTDVIEYSTAYSGRKDTLTFKDGNFIQCEILSME